MPRPPVPTTPGAGGPTSGGPTSDEPPSDSATADGPTSSPGRGPLLVAAILTLATGATDAISFLRLDNVFTSVMTGNLVVLGLSVGQGDAARASHVVVAVAGFVLGVLASSRVVGPPDPDRRGWPVRFLVVLAAELLVLVGFAVAWAAVGARPSPAAQLGLLAASSLAMGAQTGAVRGIGFTGLPTTYLTGTLTTLLTDLGATGRVHWGSLALLGSLLLGATSGGVLLVHTPVPAAVLPAALVAAGFVAALIVLRPRPRPRRRPPRRPPR